VTLCPVCGGERTEGDVCPVCSKKIHRRLEIRCVLECAPNGLSKQEGALLIDRLSKLFLSRGINPIDISFSEPYVWMDVEITKEEIERLQRQGVLQK